MSSAFLPTPEEIRAVHDDIVADYAESDDTSQGTRDANAIESATHGIGYSQPSNGVFEVAASLLRNLAAHHPFVDANKRTALNIAAASLAIQGYELHADRELGLVLKVVGINRDLISERGLVDYLESRSEDVSTAPDTVRDAAEWHRDRHRTVYDWLETN